MDYITTAEAAKRLGVSRRYVQKLVQQGKIPGAVQLGHAWLVPHDFQVTRAPRGRRPATKAAHS